MALLGIDVEAAGALTDELRRWGTQTDDVVTLVMQAETVSDVPSGALPLLDQIGADGTTLASIIMGAVDELTSFRISEFATFEGIGVWRLPPHLRLSLGKYSGQLTASQRAEADAISRRIDQAVADHRVPRPEDHARLRELFSMGIADQAVASAAFALTLQGHPLQETLRMYNHEHVDAVYSHVAESMEGGVSPLASGLPNSLFPVEYRQWHDLNRELNAMRRELMAGGLLRDDVTGFLAANESAIEERQALQLEGFHGSTFTFDSEGAVSKFAAVSTTAARGGRTASSWFGGALVPLFGAADDAETMQIGAIVRDDPVAAMSFMNELGAEGVSRLPDALIFKVPDHFDQSLADYSRALAGASGDLDLTFTGDELITAGAAARLEPELLLQAPGYAPAFVIGAAATSLRVHAGGGRNWFGWLTGSGIPTADPRTLALQGVINNRQAGVFVRQLDDAGELGNLIEPKKRFGLEHAHLVGSQGDGQTPLSELLTLGGLDSQASLAVVTYLHERGGYSGMPVGTSFDGRTSAALHEAINDLRSITDVRVLNGISAMLAVGAADYIGESIRDHRYAKAQLESPFFSAYHTVLISGSGDHLFHATSGMLATDAREQLLSGAVALDDGRLARFIGAARAVRANTHLHAAELVDQSADNFSDDLAWLGTGAGLIENPVATKVSAALSVASIFTGSENTALAVSQRQIDEHLQLTTIVRSAGIIGIFGSGLVRDSAGKKVELEIVEGHPHGPSFRLLDESGEPLRIGPERGVTYQFDNLPSGYGSHPNLKNLTVNGEPVAGFLDDIDVVDGNINEAHRRASDLFADE